MKTRLRNNYESALSLNDEPLVCVFEDFIQDSEAEHLISAARDQLKQALVSSAKSGVESDGRNGRNCWIPHRLDTAISTLSDRVANLVGLPLTHAESLQVVHYYESQQYAPHFDAWDGATERGQRCMAKGGQRLVTCLLYLNDVEAGGGTCFPKLNLEIAAKKGRMLLFHNCNNGSSQRHPRSLHGGMPVEAGEKWACNFWFRESPYRTASGTG